MAEEEDGQPTKYKGVTYKPLANKKWRAQVTMRPAERASLPAGLLHNRLSGGYHQDARSAAHASDK